MMPNRIDLVALVGIALETDDAMSVPAGRVFAAVDECERIVALNERDADNTALDDVSREQAELAAMHQRCIVDAMRRELAGGVL